MKNMPLTNQRLNEYIAEKNAILKTTGRFTWAVGKITKATESLLELQKEWIEEVIASEKNHHLLNPAHDRVYILEDYLEELERMAWRGQYAPLDRGYFDPWVD